KSAGRRFGLLFGFKLTDLHSIASATRQVNRLDTSPRVKSLGTLEQYRRIALFCKRANLHSQGPHLCCSALESDHAKLNLIRPLPHYSQRPATAVRQIQAQTRRSKM